MSQTCQGHHEKKRLARRLREILGVVTQLHLSRKNHMFFVTYELEQPSSRDVLAPVQELGYHAEIGAA